MSAKYWMLVCLLGLAGAGEAMATNLESRDITTSSRGAADTSARNSGGDLLEISRDRDANRRNADGDCLDADSRHGGAAGGSEHGGQISAPTSARPARLGWQSLLPGSIQ